jgi:hypothetical protein
VVGPRVFCCRSGPVGGWTTGRARPGVATTLASRRAMGLAMGLALLFAAVSLPSLSGPLAAGLARPTQLACPASAVRTERYREARNLGGPRRGPLPGDDPSLRFDTLLASRHEINSLIAVFLCQFRGPRLGLRRPGRVDGMRKTCAPASSPVAGAAGPGRSAAGGQRRRGRSTADGRAAQDHVVVVEHGGLALGYTAGGVVQADA